MKLDIGCGANKKKGYIGIDRIQLLGVDIVCDIDTQKLPFEEGTIDEIYSHHTLEHCKNIIHVMNEFFRVCKDKALITIIVPYGTFHQYVQDPTHVTPFNEDTFRKYFCDPNYVKAFSDYGIKGFFKEVDIFIQGKDILHLELHAVLEVRKWTEKLNL